MTHPSHPEQRTALLESKEGGTRYMPKSHVPYITLRGECANIRDLTWFGRNLYVVGKAGLSGYVERWSFANGVSLECVLPSGWVLQSDVHNIAVAAMGNCQRIALGYADHRHVSIWDTDGKYEVAVEMGEPANGNSVSLSSDGKLISVCNTHGPGFGVWDISDRKPKRLTFGCLSGSSAHFSPGSSGLLASIHRSDISVYRFPSSLSSIGSFSLGPLVGSVEYCLDIFGFINDVWLATIWTNPAGKPKVVVVDLATGKYGKVDGAKLCMTSIIDIGSLPHHKLVLATGLGYKPNGDEDSNVGNVIKAGIMAFIDAATWKQLDYLELPGAPPHCLACSPDGEYVAVASLGTKEVFLYPVRNLLQHVTMRGL
ncbi:MAG: WD40 repeat domain-containing protein [Patescibacteria group bacterium]